MEGVFKDQGIFIPETTLGKVIQLSEGLYVLMRHVQSAGQAAWRMGGMDNQHILHGPLPMAHPSYPDPLWMASQLKDLLDDVRCYCREK
jgi:hypothetical protein